MNIVFEKMNKRKIIFFWVLTALFAHYSCSKMSAKEQQKKNEYKSYFKEKIYTASIDKNIAALCVGENESKQIIVKNIIKGRNSLFHQVKEGKQVMPVRLSGNRLVWVEYRKREDENAKWELCTKTMAKGDSVKIILSNQQGSWVNFPHFDIFENLIVSDFFKSSFTDSIYSPAFLYNTKTAKLKKITPPKGYDLYTPSFNGTNKNEIVCNLVKLENNKAITKIALYTISKDSWKILDITASGFQPAIYDRKIVFKESSSPYAYGKIQLYNLSSGEKKTISTHSLGGEFPQINDRYVVWESPSFNQIPAYDLQTQKNIHFDKGTTGKPYLRGKSLIWIAEDSLKRVAVKSRLL